MVNVIDIVKGGNLDYGQTMESDRTLQEWLSSLPNIPYSQGEGKWGMFVLVSSTHKQLAINIDSLKSEDGNLEDFVKILNSSRTKDWSHTDWLKESNHMAEFGKLLSQKENQQLLGLVLSSTLGKPLRYCIQNEILPSANYWSYYADQSNSLAEDRNTVIVIVGSSNPVLAVSRALSPMMSKGINVVLVPQDENASRPCLLLGELMNKAGLNCSVYAASQGRLKDIAELKNATVIVCGSYKQALSLRAGSSHLQLDCEGKKAVVVMETGDCDAAVDAAIVGLKTSCHRSPGLYMAVQESMLDEISWRLRERFSASRSGDLLDKMVDFSTDPRYEAPRKLTEYLKGTQLEVLQVGNARVVFDVQPSMPLTQMEILGQTLFVFCYRSVNELVNLLGNFPDIGEVSLWSEQQSVALHVIHRIQVPRIWVNGCGVHELGFDRLIPIQIGQAAVTVEQENEAQINTSLYSVLDSLLAAQRSWAAQNNRNLLICKTLKQLLQQDSFANHKEMLMNLLSEAGRYTGTLATSSVKRGLVLDLVNPVGIVAVIASDPYQLDSLIRLIIVSLLNGNGLILSAANNSALQTVVKIVKEVGLPNVLITCSLSNENSRAILKHHGTRMVVLSSSSTLPIQVKDHIKRISTLELSSSRSEYVTVRRWVWLATGEGLAN